MVEGGRGLKGQEADIAEFLCPNEWQLVAEVPPSFRINYRGTCTSLIRKRPPPQYYREALGVGLLQSPERRRFLMSEVTLQPTSWAANRPHAASLFPSGFLLPDSLGWTVLRSGKGALPSWHALTSFQDS